MKLLIADDEAIIRQNFRKRIERSDLTFDEIYEAKNGKEALEIVEEKQVDIALIDINMPFVNGLELMEKLHERKKDITMIVISGYGEFEYAQKAIAYGVYRYLLKPVDAKELLGTLQEAIQEKSEANPLLKENCSPTIAHIFTILEANYGDADYSLEHLSLEIGLSSGHITKLLKSEEGITFSECLTNIRMQHAKEMLEEYGNAIKIYEVAEACGYSNQHYFAKVFKKEVGVTPKQYATGKKEDERKD